MIFSFIGLEAHKATMYKTGLVVCSCNKTLDKVRNPQDVYPLLERHIRIKTGHQGSLVKAE